ncbi:MAG: tRNA (adenosine(37)-N6)-threonylcarbamoyltransferase complex ATPase subunit type 1 TsaE [Bacteroidales bacterium]|nr:tRNA (adenosine(37)-N6)-threonylcarbamoyltransferase complex ATPase subunit type 1 TsaE [Bacteroidales bacterium]
MIKRLNLFFEMTHEIIIRDLKSIDDAARAFLEETKGRNLIAFYAPMGAGKTTFTTAICRVLGVNSDAVSSPTFSIINEYKAGDGSPIFHFDFYRITRIAEALDIGFYDYIDSGSLCLMEWPENIEDIIPEETLRASISVCDDGSRKITWTD